MSTARNWKLIYRVVGNRSVQMAGEVTGSGPKNARVRLWRKDLLTAKWELSKPIEVPVGHVLGDVPGDDPRLKAIEEWEKARDKARAG